MLLVDCLWFRLLNCIVFWGSILRVNKLLNFRELEGISFFRKEICVFHWREEGYWGLRQWEANLWVWRYNDPEVIGITYRKLWIAATTTIKWCFAESYILCLPTEVIESATFKLQGKGKGKVLSIYLQILVSGKSWNGDTGCLCAADFCFKFLYS